MTGSKRIMVARSGAIAMCLEAAENPMMYVPWWVNIGWFQGDAQLQLREVCETQSSTSTIRADCRRLGMVARTLSSVLIAMASP